MNRYCIWFITPDDSVMRRAEVALENTLHNHQVLETIETQLAQDCGFKHVLVVNWKRFEDTLITEEAEGAERTS